MPKGIILVSVFANLPVINVTGCGGGKLLRENL